jgi:hypothetical protein
MLVLMAGSGILEPVNTRHFHMTDDRISLRSSIICEQTISSGLSEIDTTGHDVSNQVVSMNKTIS